MTENQRYWLILMASLIVACIGWYAPSHRMPLDYDAVISVVWAAILGFCLWRYKSRGLWLVWGTPLALYWPIWLLFNRFPACYYSHNCA
jgi:hypothetical protein